MKILVISDTHKNVDNLIKAVEENPEIGIVFHLGDHDFDLEEVKKLYPEKTYYTVCGNNDFGSVSAPSGVQRIAGRTVFYTHGHLFSVHAGTDKLVKEAVKNRADIALFGHTHIPFAKCIEGVHLFNPGSASKPLGGSEKSYGIIEVGPELFFVHKKLK